MSKMLISQKKKIFLFFFFVLYLKFPHFQGFSISNLLFNFDCVILNQKQKKKTKLLFYQHIHLLSAHKHVEEVYIEEKKLVYEIE